MLRVGIDIGGTKVNVGVLDESGRVLAKEYFPIQNTADLPNFVTLLHEKVRAALQTAHADEHEVGFCGIGIPGSVAEDRLTVTCAPNLGWNNLPLGQLFQAKTGYRVQLVQDAKAAAWGEYCLGAGKGQDLLCVTLGTGIGTGIVLNGTIYEGAMHTAGELGHVPVKENGRACGCGKKGCMESYAAGKGLTQTAQELYGAQATAHDLFAHAANGDVCAQQALHEAIEMLGAVLVAAVNLFSPACLLLSGGLSERKKEFAEPLMQYIRTHAYQLADQPICVKYAALGADAPMIGAAMLPVQTMLSPQISASIMCGDLLHLENDLRLLEQNDIEYLHCDIMDGHFVPNWMLPPEMINKIRAHTAIPLDVHIMAENPEAVIARLDLREGDICSVHVESTVHLQRALQLIADKGALPAAAMNPSTPIESIREVLSQLYAVVVMTVNPGFSGQKLIPQTLDKITRMRRYLDQHGCANVRIQVDGNCSIKNAALMRQHGADMFVAGTSSIFNQDPGIEKGTKQLREAIR